MATLNRPCRTAGRDHHAAINSSVVLTGSACFAGVASASVSGDMMASFNRMTLNSLPQSFAVHVFIVLGMDGKGLGEHVHADRCDGLNGGKFCRIQTW